MFEAWEQWREVAIKRGMVAIKKEEWEISQQKGCLRYVNWPRSLLTVTWPPCSCFPSDLRPTLHCLSICNQPPSPKIATSEIWEARFLNHTFWSGPAAASFLPFYWAMIRCTASCKDVPILSPLLTRGPCPNIGQVSRQRFMYLQFTLNTVATILQHNNLFVRFLRPFRRNLAGDDKWFKYCWWSSRHMCC